MVLNTLNGLPWALQAYRPQLAPTVVQHLQEVSAACPPGAAGSLPPPHGALAGGDSSERLVVPDAVCAKEAVYAAMGTGAYELHDYVDFTPWFRTTLLQVGKACCLSVDCCITPLRERWRWLMCWTQTTRQVGCAVGWDVNWHIAASSESPAGGCVTLPAACSGAVGGAGLMSGLPACSGRFAAGSHPGLAGELGRIWQCCYKLRGLKLHVFSQIMDWRMLEAPTGLMKWQAAVEERQAAQMTGLW